MTPHPSPQPLLAPPFGRRGRHLLRHGEKVRAHEHGLSETDAVIIGGGHNGLVCAAYLAAAGLKVTVLERRHVVGGAAVTEEFFPGLPQLRRLLHRVAAQPEGDPRPRPARARAADRRARDREFPAAAGRALPEDRRRARRRPRSRNSPTRDADAARRISGDARGDRRRAARARAGDAAERRRRRLGAALPELFKAAKLGNRLRGLDIGDAARACSTSS